jgi:tetratricopeptide (TPR) repeat protein
MPLNFSGSAPTPDSSILATGLPPRAQAVLAAGDLDAYRELFTQAERLTDPHRRYWASLRLVERGLLATAGASNRRLPAIFATLAAGALESLEREPCEPRLLNYAGVALYELWSLDAARELFKAAVRLDPSLGEAKQNLTQVAARQRALRSARSRAPLHPSLPDLARRAIKVAERAQPATGLRLSLCMIVRDEQEMLPRCLAAVVDAVDEIVIVDTGSSDRTIEIARSFGAQVIEREWTGSFADARNVSFDAATGDWLMYLDADEVLVGEDAPLLRSLTTRTWREAFYLAETNYTGELDAGTAVTHNALRVFRNRPEYRFEGRLHEQIAKFLPGYLPERLEPTNVRIEHYGYLGVVRDTREKSRRNIELLRMQQAESPPTPFLHYNLGSEYAAAGDTPAAAREFERASELMEADPHRDTYEFAPALANRLVKSLQACGRHEEALARAAEALERFPGFTDLVLEQAAAHLALNDADQAIALYERCIEMGDAPRQYTATVGCGTYLPRISLGELRLARGETEQAVELLEHCVREHPEFIASLLPYASALLARGVTPEKVVAEVEQRIPDLSAMARFMLGTALYEAGATAAGETQFRAVLARQPHSSRARVALGEALLAQKRYQESAAVAGELSVEDPLAVAACRTELFARLVEENLDRDDLLDAALLRARAAAMPTAELDLFEAWHELVRDGHTEIRLGAQVVPLLETILKALLRIEDFQSFERLLPALERTPLPDRERRELRANVYLRRGFLSSAAEEWMGVCHEEPDFRALFGLAQVAERQGMFVEATDFAQAALQLEPESPAAIGLLDRVREYTPAMAV